MICNQRFVAIFVMMATLGMNANSWAAAFKINVAVNARFISVEEASEVWADSVARYAACVQAGGTTCLNTLGDPAQIVGGSAFVETDFGFPFSASDLITFNSREEVLIPVPLYVNRFLDLGGTAINGNSFVFRRQIGFDSMGSVPAGPQDIFNYELFDGGVTNAGRPPRSTSIIAESFDLFDEESGLLFWFTPERVATDFKVSLYNVGASGTQSTIDTHTEALAIVDGSQPEIFAFSVATYPSVNFGGGKFSGDETFPDGGPDDDSRNDYIMTARTQLDIPEGEWAIAFGSDDGGQLTLDGVEFRPLKFNEDNPPGNPDQIFFDGNRDYGWTRGDFWSDGLVNVDFFASMHDRDGPDAFEIIICDRRLSQCTIDGDLGPTEGWVILREGALGWGVGTEFEVGPEGALDQIFAPFPVNFTIPEPSSSALICFGSLLLGLMLRRRVR